MEDVLEVYQRPYDGNEVLVCMDETSKQQVKETRVPRPAAPGLSAAYDYEYERNGVSSLFMLFAPLDGWRRVEVRERRTKVDWAHVIKKLVDEDYPDRDRIVLVMDNLNTHKLSSLYEAFEPAEARRIAERLEIHYTPKHGSWLNMAEIEIGVLARQCLDRRIANQDILRGEVNAWQNQRNRDVIRVDWRFTTEDARIKLKSLYPSIQKNVEPLASRNGLATVAFPAISTGAYGFPLEPATRIALRETVAFLEGDLSLKKVLFVCFGKEDYDTYRAVFEEIFPSHA